ncbi:MAG: efflux RND transporter periplasmic adaptor subunit [Sandarakinorhabdus sp.]|nr:efflux RND transporter periplasmic adaptor subunit [Sandarakinorhabdus sp.]
MPFFAVERLIGSAALLALIAGCSPLSASGDPAPRYVATASGRLDARAEARNLAAERDGRIAAVLVHAGDQVEKGQPLFLINCADIAAQARAGAARAAADTAEARLVAAGPRAEAIAEAAARAAQVGARRADAADLLGRAESLHSSGFVSERRLAQLRADMTEAQAQAAAADAALLAMRHGARPDERTAADAKAAGATADAAALSAALDKCTLRAPAGGQVLKILRREGEFSGASTGVPLVVVGDLSAMIVRTEIIDRDAAAVRIGQRAEIWIDGAPRRWPGRIIEASSLMGRRTTRSLDPSDRFDRDVREILVAFDGPAPAPIVGLRVNVGLLR